MGHLLTLTSPRVGYFATINGRCNIRKCIGEFHIPSLAELM